MPDIVQFIMGIFAPVSPGMIISLTIAGFIFSFIYIFKLNINQEDIFHIAMCGWVFIASIFLYRMVSSLTGGPVPSVSGWLGVALLWGIYCLSTSISMRLLCKFKKRLNEES